MFGVKSVFTSVRKSSCRVSINFQPSGTQFRVFLDLPLGFVFTRYFAFKLILCLKYGVASFIVLICVNFIKSLREVDGL